MTETPKIDERATFRPNDDGMTDWVKPTVKESLTVAITLPEPEPERIDLTPSEIKVAAKTTQDSNGAALGRSAGSACFWKYHNGHGGEWETQCGAWYDADDFGCSSIRRCPKCGRETTTVKPNASYPRKQPNLSRQKNRTPDPTMFNSVFNSVFNCL
jgi:hypothetical protein